MRASVERKKTSPGKAKSRRGKEGVGLEGRRSRICPGGGAKITRPAFDATVQEKLPVKSGQARCHMISWKCIADNVCEICYYACEYLRLEDWFWENMGRLWYAVTGKYEMSLEYESALGNFLKETDKKKAAGQIAVVLNNQLGNLRVGAGDTNSSIQNALDLPESSVEKTMLSEGTVCAIEWREPTGQFKKCRRLSENIEVILIKDSEIIKRLMAFLDIQTSVEPDIYTTGDTIQSSDYKGMNCGNDMKPGKPIGFKMQKPYFETGEMYSEALYYLFTPIGIKMPWIQEEYRKVHPL